MPTSSFRSNWPAHRIDPRRRRAIAVLMTGCAAGLLAPHSRSWAGAQQYEALADSMRAALSAAIADRAPPVRKMANLEERVAFLDWLGTMSLRLKARKPDYDTRVEFLRTLDYEAMRAGLDRQLVLGLIEVESNFRKYAISAAGARGYMQVMPFWTRLIGDGDERKLFDVRGNLRYGCVILRHYIDVEHGDLYLALGRYNGSRGRPEYPNAVYAAWKGRWSFVPTANKR
jgi:soluble lytic murein transglycosylase-like protein